MNEKKLMVIGASILQIPIIKRAREKGYYTVVIDGNPAAAGLPFADKSIIVDITSKDKVLRVAQEEHIDGVIHPCSEVAMDVMGYVNEKMGLSGISMQMAKLATNKHLMREAFERYGASSPKSYCTSSGDEAWQLYSDLFSSDAILKPSRNSGSRGISKITKQIKRDEFIDLFQRAYNESRDKSVMIEQFIDGPEFSVEIIVWNGEVYVLTVTDKKTTGAPYFVEIGHNQPSIYPKENVDEITKVAVDGVKALSLNNCAVHAELKLENGKAYIMEIGARLGGDFIATELVQLSTGIDMTGAAIDVALGIKPTLIPITRAHGACIRFICPPVGILKEVKHWDVLDIPQVYDSKIKKNGDEIYEVKSSLDRSGYIIVVEDTVEEAIMLADRLVSKLQFIME